MKHLQIKPDADFKVLAGTSRSQAAIMTLKPQEATGGPDNKHDKSDQWLYVISGQGKAIVAGQEITLEAGSLLLIEAGETHEIVNSSDVHPLETLNFYTPPEY